MKSKDDQATFKVNVVVKYSKGRYKHRGMKYFAYAVYGMDLPVCKTFKEYRKRFGVESSYKLKNLALPRTSTKNPVLRLLYVGLAFSPGERMDLCAVDVSKYEEEGREKACQVAVQDHAQAGLKGA